MCAMWLGCRSTFVYGWKSAFFAAKSMLSATQESPARLPLPAPHALESFAADPKGFMHKPNFKRAKQVVGGKAKAKRKSTFLGLSLDSMGAA